MQISIPRLNAAGLGPAARPRLVRLALGAGVLAAGLAGAVESADAASMTARVRDDVLTVSGTNGSDKAALKVSSANPSVLIVDVNDDGSADFQFDRAQFTRIVVNAAGGDDTIRIDTATTFTDTEHTTVNGEAGNDRIIGGRGPEFLYGGGDDDVISGGGGSDAVYLGAGNDEFVWNPGDGSDLVEGESGSDKLTFNGSGAAENYDIRSHSGRVYLSRDVGAVQSDLNGFEHVGLTLTSGVDSVTVHDLSGSGVQTMSIDLASQAGSPYGDGRPDQVNVTATPGNDNVRITGAGGDAAVSGLPVAFAIRGAETHDTLKVRLLDGHDVVDASSLPATAIGFAAEGDRGDDILYGGDGGDVIDGGAGRDIALLRGGNDEFVWNPGDGNDLVLAGAGRDTFRLNGSNAAETIALRSTLRGTVDITRDVGGVKANLYDLETIDLSVLGGADVVDVGDLTGSGVSYVRTRLAGTQGGSTGDRANDRVIVTGTPNKDHYVLSGNSNLVSVTGLSAQVDVSSSDGVSDRLTLKTLGGGDTWNVSRLAWNAIGVSAE